MNSYHAQVLSILINGVFTSDERVEVLKWRTHFADTCIANQAQHLLLKYRTTQCSVCAFINRCGVIQPGLGHKVRELDSALHAVGVHLPVTWTIICILGAILLDVYTSSVDAEIDTWYLQPGDLIHHYMISSKCSYDRDGPMVALRDACSFLAEHAPTDNEEGDNHYSPEEVEDSCEPDEIVMKEGTKGPETQNLARTVVNRLLAMMTASDASAGRCEDMAYIPIADKAQAAVMHIPNSVMLKEALVPEQGDPNINQGLAVFCPPTQTDKHDNLYAIYTDLTMYDAGVNDREGEYMEIEEEHIDKGADKAITLMMETYQWMRALANTVVL
jgi:hypothetical protein